MGNDKLVCKVCGNDSFAQGELGGSMANVKPVKLRYAPFFEFTTNFDYLYELRRSSFNES